MRLAASREGTAPGGVPRQLFRTAWVRGACLFPWSRAELRSRERPRGLDMSCDHVNLSKKAKLFEMEALVTDLSLDLKERLFVKLRDSNRTLASLTAERVKKVCVDGVHSAVFDATFPELPRHCRLRDLSSLTSLSPLQSLVRFHHSGDFCLVCPVSQCSESVPAPHLMSMLSTASITPPPWLKDDFAVRSGQLLLPLARHGQSTFFQVAIPYPGEHPDISEDSFPSVPLSSRLPLASDECPLVEPVWERGKVHLSHVRRGDVRVCVENQAARRLRSLGKEERTGVVEDLPVAVGDKLLVRGGEFVVKEVIDGELMPRGMKQLVVDHPFSFTGRHIPCRVFSSVCIRLQCGLVPESVIHNYQPFTIDFSPSSHNCGRLSMSFTTVAFNESLTSHRNPFSFCQGQSLTT